MERLSEIYVKSDLHAKIIQLKGAKTSDQFLRELLKDGNLDQRGPGVGSRDLTKPVKQGRGS